MFFLSSNRPLRDFAALTSALSIFFISNQGSLTYAQAGAQQRTASIAKCQTDDVVRVTTVRNLNDQNWLENLEIYVKNLSHKPVYFLEVYLLFPDAGTTEVDGIERKWLIPLRYGRRDLMKRDQF